MVAQTLLHPVFGRNTRIVTRRQSQPGSLQYSSTKPYSPAGIFFPCGTVTDLVSRTPRSGNLSMNGVIGIDPSPSGQKSRLNGDIPAAQLRLSRVSSHSCRPVSPVIRGCRQSAPLLGLAVDEGILLRDPLQRAGAERQSKRRIAAFTSWTITGPSLAGRPVAGDYAPPQIRGSCQRFRSEGQKHWCGKCVRRPPALLSSTAPSKA